MKQSPGRLNLKIVALQIPVYEYLCPTPYNLLAFCFLLQQQGQLKFEDKWPSMRPTVLKLLRQETVTRAEWQDLFW